MSIKPGVALSLRNIARDHEDLHRIFEAIEEACVRTPADRDALLRLLDLLRTTLQTHFREEEQLMARFSYPQLGGHKWQHEILAEHLGTLHASVEAGEAPSTRRLIAELRHLVVDHSDESDCELIAHVIAAASNDEDSGGNSDDCEDS